MSVAGTSNHQHHRRIMPVPYRLSTISTTVSRLPWPDPLARSRCLCWSDRRGLSVCRRVQRVGLLPVVCCAVIQVLYMNQRYLVPLYPTPPLSSQHNSSYSHHFNLRLSLHLPSPPFLHPVTSYHVKSHPARHQTQPCRPIPKFNHHPPFRPACLTPQVIRAHGRRPQPPIQEGTQQSP
jgi:hypothetical protein